MRKIEEFYQKKILGTYLDKIILRGSLSPDNEEKLVKFISEIRGDIGGYGCYFSHLNYPGKTIGKVFINEFFNYAIKFKTHSIIAPEYIVNIIFNPSKMNPRDLLILKKSILPLFDNLKLVRFDIAFDCNFKLMECYKQFPYMRSWHFRGSLKEITSQSWGKLDTNGRFIDLYNKKSQDREKFVRKKYGREPIVQRLEFRYRNNLDCMKILNNELDIFKRAEIFEPTGYKFQKGKYIRKQKLTNQEKKDLKNLIDNPATKFRANEKEKKEYQKLISSLEKIDLIPLFQSALDTKKAAIKDELESYLIS